MSIDQFDEDSYEQTLIELFQGMGYQYECGYDVERDFREPYYADELRKSLRRLSPMLSDEVLSEAIPKGRYSVFTSTSKKQTLGVLYF